MISRCLWYSSSAYPKPSWYSISLYYPHPTVSRYHILYLFLPYCRTYLCLRLFLQSFPSASYSGPCGSDSSSPPGIESLHCVGSWPDPQAQEIEDVPRYIHRTKEPTLVCVGWCHPGACVAFFEAVGPFISKLSAPAIVAAVQANSARILGGIHRRFDAFNAAVLWDSRSGRVSLICVVGRATL